ncbi:MAG: porin [Alphaproteobacteria bacterium]|nr:porin [Alphaproteobacteria bacterium]
MFKLFLALLFLCVSGSVHAKRIAAKGATLRIGGQISPCFSYHSGKDLGQSMFGTVGSSNSRLFVWHNTRLPNGMSARGTLEMGFNINSTSHESPWNPKENTIDIRKAYVSLLSERLGVFYFGKLKTATDDSAEQDCSYAAASIPALIEGVSMHIANHNGFINFGSVHKNFDGDRANGVRYDTPIYKGMGLRFDLHNAIDPNRNNSSVVVPGIALFGKMKILGHHCQRDGEIRFASGFSKKHSRLKHSTDQYLDTNAMAWTNSFSCVLPCEVGFTVVYSRLFYDHDVQGSVNLKKHVPYYHFSKVTKWFRCGPNPLSLSFEYGASYNTLLAGPDAASTLPDFVGKATSAGIVLGYSIPALGIDAFLAYKRLAYSGSSQLLNDQGLEKVRFEPTNLFMIGMRVIF